MNSGSSVRGAANGREGLGGIGGGRLDLNNLRKGFGVGEVTPLFSEFAEDRENLPKPFVGVSGVLDALGALGVIGLVRRESGFGGRIGTRFLSGSQRWSSQLTVFATGVASAELLAVVVTGVRGRISSRGRGGSQRWSSQLTIFTAEIPLAELLKVVAIGVRGRFGPRGGGGG